MNLELTKHLAKVRETINQVDRIVLSHKYPSDKRTVMVMGLLSTIVEYLQDMLLLIRYGGTAGSLEALARGVLIGTRQGLWINSCATEGQILRIEEHDEFPFSIQEMTKQIDTAYDKDPFFENLKNDWATQIYKYSRLEILKLGRWGIDTSSGLRVDDQEIREVTTIATLAVVLLAGKFIASQKHSDDCQRLEALAADYAN